MAEEIGFENGRNSNFQRLVTLTLDPAIRHTVVHHTSTCAYVPNFIEIEETFYGRTDVQTDIFPPLILLGRLSEVDLITTRCVGGRHNIPRPCKLTFNLLTLKVVTESRVTWATSVPILVFLGLSVLDLGPMYATDRRQTASSLNAPA